MNLEEYGYIQADQDGYDGERVSPEEHKEEEFFAALEEMLDATTFCIEDQGGQFAKNPEFL